MKPWQFGENPEMPSIAYLVFVSLPTLILFVWLLGFDYQTNHVQRWEFCLDVNVNETIAIGVYDDCLRRMSK